MLDARIDRSSLYGFSRLERPHLTLSIRFAHMVKGPYFQTLASRLRRIVNNFFETKLAGSSLPTGSHEIPTNLRLLPTEHPVTTRRVAPFGTR